MKAGRLNHPKGFSLIEIVLAMGLSVAGLALISTLLMHMSQQNRRLQDRINLIELRQELGKNMASGILCTCLFKDQRLSTVRSGTGRSRTTSFEATFPGSQLPLYANEQCDPGQSVVVASVGASQPVAAGGVNFSSIKLANIKASSSMYSNTRYVGDLIFTPDFKNGVQLKPLVFNNVSIQTELRADGTATRRILGCGWQDANDANSAYAGDLTSGRLCGDQDLCVGDYKIRISNNPTLNKNIMVTFEPNGAPGKYRILARTATGRVAVFSIDLSTGQFQVHQQDDYTVRLCYNAAAVTDNDWCDDYAWMDRPTAAGGTAANCGNDLYFRVQRLSNGETKDYTTASCSSTKVGPSCGQTRTTSFGPCPMPSATRVRW